MHHSLGAHNHKLENGTVGRHLQGNRLRIVLVITGLFMVVEVVGGILANSLALLADAGHMFTDVLALGLSLIATRFAMRSPSPERTFGYVRLEILAALVNGAVLLGISVWIAWEAWGRLQSPQDVDGPLLLTVACLGLIVNLIGAALLREHATDNLNVRGAYLHIIGDLLGSVGAIGSGIIIILTGWTPADPLASIIIAGLILLGAWRLTKEAAEILLEMSPRHLDMTEILNDLTSIQNLEEVHDLHVWTLTSGFIALSAHGVLRDPTYHQVVLDEIRELMKGHGIEHVTFQLEPKRLHQITLTKTEVDVQG